MPHDLRSQLVREAATKLDLPVPPVNMSWERRALRLCLPLDGRACTSDEGRIACAAMVLACCTHVVAAALVGTLHLYYQARLYRFYGKHCCTVLHALTTPQ